MRWFLAAILLLASALILESGLLAYAMYVLLALLLASRWLTRNWLRNLSARRWVRLVRDTTSLLSEQAGGAAHATWGKPGRAIGLSAEIGERVVVRVVVQNASIIPVPWVLLEDLLPSDAIRTRSPRLKIRGKRLQIGLIRSGGELEMRYQLECVMRGYYQIGPLVLETGDLFGLHRRYRVVTEPIFLLVYPRIVPLVGYDLASRRPIGDVQLIHRLYEDPTRIAGVRPYEVGDPLNRVHWKATARTGTLHSKVHEPSTLAGATLMLDFRESGYPGSNSSYRCELAAVAVASLANALCEMNQQVGLITNGGDAVDRIRGGSGSLEPDNKPTDSEVDPRTRREALQSQAMTEESDRLRPLIVETRRGIEQLQRIREVLARLEMSEGLTFAELLSETAHRIPRDATVVAVLPDVSEETAIALGNLHRRGQAVAVVLILLTEDALERAYARLVAEGIRDLRHLAREEDLTELCSKQVQRTAYYEFA